MIESGGSRLPADLPYVLYYEHLQPSGDSWCAAAAVGCFRHGPKSVRRIPSTRLIETDPIPDPSISFPCLLPAPATTACWSWTCMLIFRLLAHRPTIQRMTIQCDDGRRLRDRASKKTSPLRAFGGLKISHAITVRDYPHYDGVQQHRQLFGLTVAKVYLGSARAPSARGQ